MNCGAEDGTVVGAHENSLEAGKGMGIKADDVVALLCGACHDFYDGRAPNIYDPTGKYMYHLAADKELMWLRAFKKSVKWMVQNGKLKVVA